MSKMRAVYLCNDYPKVIEIDGLEIATYQVTNQKDIISRITTESFNKNPVDIIIIKDSLMISENLAWLGWLNNIKKFIILANEEFCQQWIDIANQNHEKLSYIREFFLEEYLEGLVQGYSDDDLLSINSSECSGGDLLSLASNNCSDNECSDNEYPPEYQNAASYPDVVFRIGDGTDWPEELIFPSL